MRTRTAGALQTGTGRGREKKGKGERERDTSWWSGARGAGQISEAATAAAAAAMTVSKLESLLPAAMGINEFASPKMSCTAPYWSAAVGGRRKEGGRGRRRGSD